MITIQNTALILAALITVAALALVVDRGGLIAWVACILGALLFARLWLRPGSPGLWLSISLACVTALAWLSVFYYVIFTYESGEVVELAIDTSDGIHTLRLWVLDVGTEEIVYHDSAPKVATSLLAGTPLKFTRRGVVSQRLPKARMVESLPEAEANSLLESMNKKYGSRTNAAYLYYVLLGLPRDRVPLVVNLVEP